MNKNQQTSADVTALLRARNTLLWIVTREEKRVEGAIIEAAKAAEYETVFWDCALGFSDTNGKQTNAGAQDPSAALDGITRDTSRRVYVLRDLHKWIADPTVLRRVRNAARALQGSERPKARTMIVLSPSSEIPPELAGHAIVIDWPLPEREEISALLDDVIKSVREDIAAKALVGENAREKAIDAAVGLTAEEAASCFARSLVLTQSIDAAMVASEKRRVIAREKVLTWYDPDPRGLDAVGGLDVLKSWLKVRQSALSQRARDFGLPSPKGCFLVGVPGCLAEGTRIEYKRGERVSSGGRSLPIEAFFAKFNGIPTNTRPWVANVPTFVQSWDPETGKIVYNEVSAVVDSGVKQCIRVVTDTSGELECTDDHPVLVVRDGKPEFVEAGALVAGDRLLVRGSMKPTSIGKPRIYSKRVIVEGLRFHPVAWKKVVIDQDTGKRYEYGRITRARLVVEAWMNRIELQEFIEILKSKPAQAETLVFLQPEYDVHHIDENPMNDAIENLMVALHDEHARLHGDESTAHFNVEYTVESRVTSIQEIGPRRTFDVTMGPTKPNLVVNRGIIVHNCGKSLTAKAVASAWGVPLLRLDMGALRSKWIGESEGNIRRALAVAETVSPCVLWLDEIEKALAGSSGPAGDGGVAADALGTILSWMQERAGSVFVVATANDVRALPPELLRKGRFDELFFVDLPTREERAAITRASLKQFGREVSDIGAIVDVTAGFTGAEIAAIVPDALFAAFNDNERALTVSDLIAAAKTVAPLSQTAAPKIEELREWAKGKARPASTPEVENTNGRKLDL